ncbi:hypothetical protein IFM89_035228 [Coptis chinensis]|uniref:EXS domain-containing protein n=1 Tax=Coptis chinensis TaxID=261450 RepID=A0A835IHS1_9MAGN|nr:hypothetical protein IFM89_035228 [Coptis chinensis]
MVQAGLLKWGVNWNFLNLLAFAKIVKKYDKINKLLERVEATFIKHFANANRSKGINILRPKAKRERHRVTYSLCYITKLFLGDQITSRVRINYGFPLWQCLRCLYEEKDEIQGYNSLKYFTTIVAVCMRTTYGRQNTLTWKVMAFTSSAITATVELETLMPVLLWVLENSLRYVRDFFVAY